MVSKLALLASLVLIGSTANAEPPASTPAIAVPGLPADRGYLGMGAAALVSRSTAIAVTGEGAVRIGPTPFLIRGMAASGSLRSPWDPKIYHIVEVRLGVEADACATTRWACVFTGVDLGYLGDSFTSTDTHSDVYLQPPARRFMVLPRVGFELGTRLLRLRSAFEYGQDAAGLQLALMLHF